MLLLPPCIAATPCLTLLNMMEIFVKIVIGFY